MCDGKCDVSGGLCCNAKPSTIVEALEKIDAEELLAYWRNLDKGRKDAIKRKLMRLAFA
jgi:hypothetical protein